MGLDRCLDALVDFGLKRTDARVYVFLAKKGPRTGKDLCTAMNMPKHQVYQCLRNLENKGILTASFERPAIFAAVPIEKVLELLIKAKIEEAKHTEQDKERAIFHWKSSSDNFRSSL